MSFLRRLLGGGSGRGAGTTPRAGGGRGTATVATDEDEAERDRRLAREEADRLDDALIQRQLRYADRKWTPPVQGGDRRADDHEGGER